MMDIHWGAATVLIGVCIGISLLIFYEMCSKWHPTYLCSHCNYNTGNWNAGICPDCGSSETLTKKAKKFSFKDVEWRYKDV